MYYNDSYLAKDCGLPQSCIAAVKLLFVFPDILDFIAAVINRAVEQCESWLGTGGAHSKYLEIQMMVNNVVTENVGICASLCWFCFSGPSIFFAAEKYTQNVQK